MAVATRVRVRLADDQIRARITTGPTSAGVRFVNDVCRRVQNEAKVRCPVDTGRLRASIDRTVRIDGDKVRGFVGTDVEYARPVHDGYRRGNAIVEGRPFLLEALRAVSGTL